jgi:hypothetical protein
MEPHRFFQGLLPGSDPRHLGDGAEVFIIVIVFVIAEKYEIPGCLVGSEYESYDSH